MMLNNYTILYFLALAVFIQSMPTNITDSSGEEDEEDHEISHPISTRDIQNTIIDGSIHFIKSAGITYSQHVKHNKCSVKYDDQTLGESSVIKIRKKMFRVDNCLLERVYHACGPNLILMMSVACRLVERHKDSNAIVNFKRQSDLSSMVQYNSIFNREKRVITESCCENLCSISELTRYCHE